MGEAQTPHSNPPCCGAHPTPGELLRKVLQIPYCLFGPTGAAWGSFPSGKTGSGGENGPLFPPAQSASGCRSTGQG